MSTLQQQSGLQEQLDLLKTHLDATGIMDPDESQTLIDTISGNADLSPAEKEQLIHDISNIADIPVGTDTREKVARWRKIIISLILAGFTGITLENIIPGIYYTLYERISTTITSLLIAGISSVQIREIINNPSIPIPDIPISGPNIPGLMATLTEALKTGFFTAASMAVGCIDMVCRGGERLLNQLTIENFNYTAKLAGQLAVPKGISYAYKVLRGEFDGEIANAIDKGITQQILDSVDDTVTDVKRHIIEAVTESAEDVRDMSLGITWTDVAPNSGLDPSINSIINNAISNEIEKMITNPKNKTSTSKLLNDILNVLRSDNKADAIASFKVNYQDIPNTIPELLILLTAKQSELEPGRKGISQPDPDTLDLPSVTAKKDWASQDPNYELPIGPNPMVSKFEPKYDSRKFDVVVAIEALKKCGLIKQETDEKKITWDQSNNLLNVFINIYLNDKDPKLVQKLNFLSPEDHNGIIKYIEEMATKNGTYAVIMSFYDAENQDKSLECLNNKFSNMYRDVKVAIDTISRDPKYATAKIGGRRQKSRQYKKRRMTQRRRTTQRKGRRSRKGKKRRSTKRRR